MAERHPGDPPSSAAARSRPRPASGWRVTPAPDGRGAAPGQPPAAPVPLAVVDRARSSSVLLALNLWISSQALQPQRAGRGSPTARTFLDQVKAGNVKAISSTGDAIQGTFKTAIRYPADDSRQADDELLHPGPVVRQQRGAVLDAAARQGVTIDAQAAESAARRSPRA